jgi:hypothetical protein
VRNCSGRPSITSSIADSSPTPAQFSVEFVVVHPPPVKRTPSSPSWYPHALLDIIPLSFVSVSACSPWCRPPSPQNLVDGDAPVNSYARRRHPMVRADEALPMHQLARPGTPPVARARPHRRDDHHLWNASGVERLACSHAWFATVASDVESGPIRHSLRVSFVR